MENATKILLPFEKESNILVQFIYHVWICIVPFGITTNIINIKVFLKMGLKDSVSVALFSLSVSDLVYLCVISLSVVANLIEVVRPQHSWPLDSNLLSTSPYIYAMVFYDYSSFISVFLALARCMCVARPLSFRSVFTRRKTWIIMAVLLLVVFSLRAPLLSAARIAYGRNPRMRGSNETQWFMKYVDPGGKMTQLNDLLNRNIISWLCYTTVTVCVIILVAKLKAASKFRLALSSESTGRGESKTTNKQPDKDLTNKTIGTSMTPLSISTSGSTPTEKRTMHQDGSKLSAKDAQVVKNVTLICTIFIFSQLPVQTISAVRLVEPEFDTDGRLKYAYSFVSLVGFTCALINASINIFVHYNFNTKYRRNFLQLLCKQKDVG